MALTEEQALEELAAAVAQADGIEVIDFESPDVRGGMATIRTIGGTPTDYQFRVIVYARSAEADVAQKTLREHRVAIENELRDDGRFGPSQWSYEWIDGTDMWACIFELTRGREDF